MKRLLIFAEDEVYCTEGDEFQNYVYKDSGKFVPIDAPVGVCVFDEKRKKERVILYDNILYD